MAKGQAVSAPRAPELRGRLPTPQRLNQIGTMAMLQAETGIGAYGMAAYTRILGIEVETTQKISRRHEEAGSAYVQRFLRRVWSEARQRTKVW